MPAGVTDLALAVVEDRYELTACEDHASSFRLQSWKTTARVPSPPPLRGVTAPPSLRPSFRRAPVTAPPELRPSFRRARPPCLLAAPAMGSRQLLDEMPELAEVAALVDTAAVGAVLG